MAILISDKEYKVWVADIKARVRSAQIKAALSVSAELLKLYWSIGADIVARQKNAKWGSSFLLRLSRDLMAEFPDMKGFSERNLKYIRQWHLFYSKGRAFGQQVVAQITRIPWGHNIVIISKCKNIKEALYYVQSTITHNWSRNVLVHQIESGLYKREGKSVTNFALTLPKPQSDLAEQTLKDPYVFDFLSMTKKYDERELESALVTHVTRFLLELGAGFSFIDSHLRKDGDQPTIGLLLCKSRERLVAEYALSDIHKPIGVSEYKLTRSLPKKLKSSLPALEEIEKELSKGMGNRDRHYKQLFVKENNNG